MSDTPLEAMVIEGCRPPYKKAAWVLGQVGTEGLLKIAQKTSPDQGTTRNRAHSAEKRRPKSTPTNKSSDETGMQRLRCSRLSQVKSARRRKSLENAFLPQEGDKISVVDLAPGYVLSRSKERISVTIRTDNFFNDEKEQKSRKKNKAPDEKDLVIAQLKKQIDDLTLLLGEDRLNHRTSMRKAAENHQNLTAQMHNQHREHIRSLEEDHKAELEKLKEFYNRELEEERVRAESETERKQNELDSLHGAFEAYKETVAAEMDYKWERRERQLYEDSQLRLKDELAKQKKELVQEKNSELDATHKEHQKQIQIIVEDHRKEIDRLMEKFSQSVADAGQLKKTLLEMQELMRENEEIKEKLKKTTDKLRKCQTELEDKKVKLQGFEENFAEKVAEVDEKYSKRMHSLMTSNTDLRRHYIKKCEQIFKLKTEKDLEQEGSLRNAKETMQAVILARSRTNVSLTALRNEDLSSNVQSPALVHPQPHFNIQDTWEKPKARPHSAPSTPKEHEVAVAETSVVEIPQTKWLNYGTGFTEFKSSKLRPHTSHNSRQSSPRASLWGIRELFHPTPVSVSDQGLRSLLENTINT